MSALKPHSVPVQANSLAAGSDIAAAQSAAWPEAEWWKQYGDPQLDDLVRRAMAGNPRMAAAQSRVDIARDMARISGAARKASVDAGAEFDRTRFSHDNIFPQEINGYHLFDPIWNNSVGLTFAYDPDVWGRDRAALEAALDQVKVTEFEAQNARLVLATAVIRAYAQLGYFYEIQDHERAILGAESRTLDLSQRRLKAGLGTELEIQQAKNAVAATQARLEDLAGQMVLLRHQLAALIGEGPAAGDVLGRPALQPSRPVGLPSEIPAELVGRRPDVQAERWRVESAAKGVAIARTAFYPNVNLKAAVGLVGFGFGRLFTDRALNVSAGPAITLPIFDGGRLRAGLAVRTSQYDVAVDAYDAAVIEALREVSDQISRFESLRKLRARREETLAFATRANELALISFRAGLTDYNNVLSTEDSLNRALISVADVGLQQVTTIAALNQALGGGLPPADGSGMAGVR